VRSENALTTIRLVSVALVLAVALALLSVHVERTGPALVAYGNLCGPSSSDPCYQPELSGGFPVAYLSDSPGTSVQRQLSFIEDDLRPAALAIDIGFYFVVFLLGARLRSRLCSRSRRRPP